MMKWEFMIKRIKSVLPRWNDGALTDPYLWMGKKGFTHTMCAQKEGKYRLSGTNWETHREALSINTLEKGALSWDAAVPEVGRKQHHWHTHSLDTRSNERRHNAQKRRQDCQCMCVCARMCAENVLDEKVGRVQSFLRHKYNVKETDVDIFPLFFPFPCFFFRSWPNLEKNSGS